MAMDPKKETQPAHSFEDRKCQCTQLAGTSPVLPVCVYVNERDGTVYRWQAAAKDAKKDDKKGKDGKGKKGGGDEKVEEKPTLKPRDVRLLAAATNKCMAAFAAVCVARYSTQRAHVARCNSAFGMVCCSPTAWLPHWSFAAWPQPPSTVANSAAFSARASRPTSRHATESPRTEPRKGLPAR
jgi:hypothetical protein